MTRQEPTDAELRQMAVEGLDAGEPPMWPMLIIKLLDRPEPPLDVERLAGRIDHLRTAIDAAVGTLNEAWGGFGPSEALEGVISDLQRARTDDDIAQGRDWPPVVLARLSADGDSPGGAE